LRCVKINKGLAKWVKFVIFDFTTLDNLLISIAACCGGRNNSVDWLSPVAPQPFFFLPLERFDFHPSTILKTHHHTRQEAPECQHSASWSPTDYLVFLGCRMMLYTFALATESPENNDSIGIESPSHWLIQGYVTTMATVQTVSSIRNQVFCAPSRLHKMLMDAVCFPLLLKCSRHYDLVNSTLCSGITQGWEMLQGLSITSEDFMSRAYLLIERLSRYSDTLGPQDETEGLLLVKSRMGANVSLSTVLPARECTRWLI
jgi:hypothetical protein